MQNRLLITFTVVLAMILGITLYINNYFKNSTTQLGYTLNTLEKNVYASSWNESNLAISDFKKQWKGSKDTWAVFTDHSEIDNIEQTLLRLEKNIQVNDRDQAVPEVAVLKEQVSHIYEKEKLNIKNIL